MVHFLCATLNIIDYLLLYSFILRTIYSRFSSQHVTPLHYKADFSLAARLSDQLTSVNLLITAVQLHHHNTAK